MNYVNFNSQCGLLNREKGKKLLKLQVGLLLLKPSCSAIITLKTEVEKRKVIEKRRNSKTKV